MHSHEHAYGVLMMNMNKFCWMICFGCFDDITCYFNLAMPMFLT